MSNALAGAKSSWRKTDACLLSESIACEARLSFLPLNYLPKTINMRSRTHPLSPITSGNDFTRQGKRSKREEEEEEEETLENGGVLHHIVFSVVQPRPFDRPSRLRQALRLEIAALRAAPPLHGEDSEALRASAAPSCSSGDSPLQSNYSDFFLFLECLRLWDYRIWGYLMFRLCLVCSVTRLVLVEDD